MNITAHVLPILIFGRAVLHATTTQRGWCIEAFVSILAHLQSQKLLPGFGTCIECLFPLTFHLPLHVEHHRPESLTNAHRRREKEITDSCDQRALADTVAATPSIHRQERCSSLTGICEKKHSSRENNPWDNYIEKHQIRGWRGVSAAALHDQGLCKRSVLLQTAVE